MADRYNTRPTGSAKKQQAQVGELLRFDAAARTARRLGDRRQKIERRCAARRLTAATFLTRNVNRPTSRARGPSSFPSMSTDDRRSK